MSESVPPRGLYVPLRSNARSLVAGSPVAALRRRLKFASIVFDRILMEPGRIVMSAGPTGAASLTVPTEPIPRFQPAPSRHVTPGSRLTLSIGAEESPGVRASVMRTAVDSELTFNWDATLEPFDAELPAGCDWIYWGTPRGSPEQRRVLSQWKHADGRSPSLKDAWPESIVRSTLISNANNDLTLAVAAGLAITQDPLHRRVLASRFDTRPGWDATAFLLPIVLPHVGDLDWDTVASLRRERSLIYFRAVMNEIEAQLLAEGAGGDIESAAHHAFEEYLARSRSDRMTVAGFMRSGVAELVVGSALGALTTSWAGPVGVLGGAAAGAGVSSAREVVKMKRRNRRAWVAAYQAILAAR